MVTQRKAEDEIGLDGRSLAMAWRGVAMGKVKYRNKVQGIGTAEIGGAQARYRLVKHRQSFDMNSIGNAWKSGVWHSNGNVKQSMGRAMNRYEMR